MKKTMILLLLVAALFQGLLTAQTVDYELPQGFTFYNEIGSDVVRVTGNAHKEYKDTNWRSEFAGIYDKIGLKFNSNKVEFELAPTFGIHDVSENLYTGSNDSMNFGHGYRVNLNTIDTANANGALNSDDLAWNYWGLNWKLRYSPFDIVDFWVHGGPDIVGSKLFARDKTWGASNLGSDGFAIITKPIDGLRVSGAIPFSFDWTSRPNYMNAEVEDLWVYDVSAGNARNGIGEDKYKFRVDLAADYTLPSGVFGAGVKVEDIISASNRVYAIYAGTELGAFAANLGYNFATPSSENAGYRDFLDAFDDGLIIISGKQAVAGSVSYKPLDVLIIAADAMYNLSPKESVYDLYTGLKVAYDLVPGKFNTDILVGLAADLGTNAHHGTIEDDFDLKNAMHTINSNFIDLYYANVGCEDDRALHMRDGEPNAFLNASENWQQYTALSREMSNGQLDTTSAAKAALAVRVRPGFTYFTGRNEFGAHVNLVNFFDGDGSYQIRFPLYWKCNF